MRIAFISLFEDKPWGGCEELWYRVAVHANEEKNDLFICVKKWPFIPEKLKIFNPNQLHFRNIYPTGSSISKKIKHQYHNTFKTEHQYLKKLKQFSPNVIIINQGGTYDITLNKFHPLRQFLSETGIPFLLISQNNTDYGFVPDDKSRFIAQDIFAKAKHYLFVSQRNKEFAELQIANKINNALVISNPVNIEKSGIIPYPTDDIINLAEVAALRCSHKGQHILIKILSQEKWRNRNWMLNLYGNGEDLHYINELIQHHDMASKVKIHGFTNDIRDVWKSNNILLLPSFGEGTPLALQEAMLCGRTAVVSDVGGNTELINHDQNGFVADVASIKSFDNALEYAWKNIEKWKEFGEKAYANALEKIDLNTHKTIYNLIKMQT